MAFCDKCGFKIDSEDIGCLSCGGVDISETLSDFDNLLSQNNLSSNLTPADFFSFPRLVIVKGGTLGREFPISKDFNNIGRWDPQLKSYPEIDLSDEDIDAKVSRSHAKINKRPEGYYIEDLGSTNGTFLNREFRLVPGVEYSLKDNDEIIIGHIFFKFQYILSKETKTSLQHS